MNIPFTEPCSPRFIHLNPNSNTLHLMMPIVSGTQIGLDNTCKSVYALQEFFAKGQVPHQNGILNSLLAYQNALEFDISLISDASELKTQKQERLEQIKQYISAIKIVLNSNKLASLNQVFPEYPQALQTLMKDEHTNLYSMVLSPQYKDNFLRSVNPVFSLQRVENASIFYKTLLEASPDIQPAQNAKQRLIRAVVERIQGQAFEFSNLQEQLRQETSRQLGIDIDFTKSKQGISLTMAYLDDLMMFEDANPPSAQDYIEVLLSVCAEHLFDTVIESPFYGIKSAEERSIVTQFFLGFLNIYCRIHHLSRENFGRILDGSEVLSQAIVSIMLSSLKNASNVEDALIDFINQNKAVFGLNHPLNDLDRKRIKKEFYERYTEIKDSPYFDEFILIDNTKPGPFLIYQGAISLNITEFMRLGFKEINPDFFNKIDHDFKQHRGPLLHHNPCVHASIELSLDRLLNKIKNLEQLNSLLKKLPKETQQLIIASPKIEHLYLAQFMSDVSHGLVDRAKHLLEQQRAPLFQLTRVEFIDNAGRHFHCSAYEYAYWAQDNELCHMLLAFMNDECRHELLKRCDIIEEQGLAYHQYAQAFRSAHFDYSPYKQALHRYIQVCIKAHSQDATRVVLREVKQHQRNLPAHISQKLKMERQASIQNAAADLAMLNKMNRAAYPDRANSLVLAH